MEREMQPLAPDNEPNDESDELDDQLMGVELLTRPANEKEQIARLQPHAYKPTSMRAMIFAVSGSPPVILGLMALLLSATVMLVAFFMGEEVAPHKRIGKIDRIFEREIRCGGADFHGESSGYLYEDAAFMHVPMLSTPPEVALWPWPKWLDKKSSMLLQADENVTRRHNDDWTYLRLPSDASRFTFMVFIDTDSEHNRRRLPANTQFEDFIVRAFKRYCRLVFGDPHQARLAKPFQPFDPTNGDDDSWPGEVTRLEVHVSSPDTGISHMTSESYFLDTAETSGIATLEAASVFGVLRGLEAFAQISGQLASKANPETAKPFDLRAPLVIPAVRIKDSPLFAWRGLRIDSSLGHLLPVASMLRMLDAMSFNKLNVLHWRVVDLLRRPQRIQTYPRAKIQPSAAADAEWYSKENIDEIVKYAHSRGIRVIPGLHLPGVIDTGVAGDGTIECHLATAARPVHVFNPASPRAWQVISEIVMEVATFFPDRFMYLSVGSVDGRCWEESKDVAAWMANNHKTVQSVRQELLAFLLDEFFKYGKRAILPEDALDAKVAIEEWQAIVETETCRKDNDGIDAVDVHAAKSHVAVLRSNCWRLEGSKGWAYYFRNGKLAPSAAQGGTQRRQHGRCGGGECLAKYPQVLGGECSAAAPVTARTLDCAVWPLGAIVAQRLWAETMNYEHHLAATEERLQWQRDRLVHRGIAAAPMDAHEERPEHIHSEDSGETAASECAALKMR